MKQFKRNAAKFEVLGLFGLLGRDEGYSFKDEKSSKRFLEKIEKELLQAKSTPTTLYGLHTQTMFRCLIVSLGKAIVVKAEDSGEIYSNDTSLRIPDFRILLEDGQEFLVEVKNYYQKESTTSYSFKHSYLNSLRKYANLFKCDLKIAIYWAKWNIWTLLPETKIKDNGLSYSISMKEAFMANEMNILGDYTVATKTPLKIRIIADKNKPRRVRNKREVNFTIGDIEFYCDDVRIDDSFEKKLVYYLMLFGNWNKKDSIARVVSNQLIAIELIAEPIEKTPNQEFEMLGSLSSMFSLYYKMITAPNGVVEKIIPRQEPSSMVFSIPKNYKGKYLPLWFFIISSKDKQMDG